MSTTGVSAATSGNELRGSVLDVVRELYLAGRGEELFAVVARLVTRNSELERLLSCQSPPSWSQVPEVSPPSWSHLIARVREPPRRGG